MGLNNDDKLDELKHLIDLEQTIQNVVQELRMRMSSVLRYVSLLRSERQEMTMQKYIQELYVEAHNASRLFDNVILQGGGKGRSSYEVCDAGAILRHTVALLDYQMKRKGILLDTVSVAEALPVKADSFRLQQAFYIVLLNAIHVLNESQNKKKIRLSCGIEEDRIRIAISLDTPAPVQWKREDLLKQFFETIERGMGMGWHTVRSTIARHGGKVAVQSERGETVSFLITLPCALAVSASRFIASDTGIEESTVPPSSQLTALIIDDEVMTGGVTAEMMSHFGFETVFFDKPLMALPLLRQRRFNIILIDYIMPNINGIEFIRQYGTLFRGADIILMSGLASLDASVVQTAFNVSILKKPFALKELQCLIQKTMMKTHQ